MRRTRDEGMSLRDHLTAADAWLLDRIFQPIADRLGERPSAFDLGLSLQLGSVVFDLAADVALFAAGLLAHLIHQQGMIHSKT